MAKFFMSKFLIHVVGPLMVREQHENNARENNLRLKKRTIGFKIS